MEAVYIVDLSGRTVLNYEISSSPPHLTTILPLVLNSKNAPGGVVELSPSRVICHQKIGNLIFIVPSLSEISLLIPFEFISRLAETLEKYFSPPVVPMKIESNLDTVALLLNEMIEDAFPFITESDALQDLVPKGNLLSKLISGFKPAPTLSTIPWRRSNVRHTNNELFVDIVETFYGMYVARRENRKLKRGNHAGNSFYTSTAAAASQQNAQVVARVEGAVMVTSNLSGIPDILLQLDLNRHEIDFPSFHPCVEIPAWEQKAGTLRFIPPDGKQLIASYTLDLDKKHEQLVQADIKTGLGVQKNEFEVRVWTKVARDIQSIEGLSVNVVCDKSRIKGIGSNLRVTNGDFHMEDSGIGEWTFPGKVTGGWSASLRGTLTLADEEDMEPEATAMSSSTSLSGVGASSTTIGATSAEPAFPQYVSLTYVVTGQVPSGIKVDSLRIMSSRGLGEGVKPFKGVRYVTNVGEYIVR